MKRIFVSQSSRELVRGKLEALPTEEDLERLDNMFEKVRRCEHRSYCAYNVNKYDDKCVFAFDSCKVKKFYDRYGNYKGQIGIGSIDRETARKVLYGFYLEDMRDF